MMLTNHEMFLTIVAIVGGTIVTRFLPFIIFPEHKQVPKYIEYLGKVLPCAVIGLLVVYCFKGVQLGEGSRGIPELLTTLSIMAVHHWKRSTLLSIGGGTLIYMFLVQVIFV